MRTVNSSRYLVDYYQLKGDGSEVWRSQGRFVGRSYHSRFESLFWTERLRPLLTMVTMDGAVFQDCVRLDDNLVDGVPSFHIRGKWQRDGHRASFDVWIAKDELINVKTLRSFSSDPPRLLPYSKPIERFRLDRSVAAPELPSEPLVYYSSP